MEKTLEFAELIMTKFCHDLSGPLSAIYNGVEFIEVEEEADLKESMAFKLIASNANIAIRQLKFFRYIYGLSDAMGEVDITTLEEISNNFFENSKIKILFDNEKTGEKYVQLTNRAGKLLLVLILLTSYSLIYGGEILVKLKRTAHVIAININGISEKNIKHYEHYIKLFTNKDSLKLQLDNVIAYKAAILAHQLDTNINVQQHTTSISFNFEIP